MSTSCLNLCLRCTVAFVSSQLSCLGNLIDADFAKLSPKVLGGGDVINGTPCGPQAIKSGFSHDISQ